MPKSFPLPAAVAGIIGFSSALAQNLTNSNTTDPSQDDKKNEIEGIIVTSLIILSAIALFGLYQKNCRDVEECNNPLNLINRPAIPNAVITNTDADSPDNSRLPSPNVDRSQASTLINVDSRLTISSV